MKKIVVLLALLVSVSAYAQEPAIQNEALKTLASTAGTASKIAVDSKGRILLGPVGTSATDLGKLASNATGLAGVPSIPVGYYPVGIFSNASLGTTTTANITGIESSAKVGDAFIYRGGAGANQNVWSVISAVSTNQITFTNAFPVATQSGATGYLLRPVLIGASTTSSTNAGVSGLAVAVQSGFQDSAALGLLKLEDSAAASGDALVGVAAVRNDNAIGVFAGTDLDYSPISVDANGKVFIRSPIGAADLAKAEDIPAGNGEVGVASLYVARDPIITSVTATNDYINPSTDLGGRTITTLAPAGESWQSCGTATASTADVAIKAAVASNRIYTTAITCKNTSATVATSLDFKDGTTVIAVGGVSQMATTAAGSFTATFPVPLRGTSNTALNFATNVSTSSVTCCASGYTSVN